MKLQATKTLLSRANVELDDIKTQNKTLKAQIEQLKKIQQTTQNIVTNINTAGQEISNQTLKSSGPLVSSHPINP